MKHSMKPVALLLIVAVIFGIAGCTKTSITLEDFISGIESYGVEKTDDIGALTNILMRRGGKDGYYIAADKEDAEKMSNLVLDKFDTFPDFKATDFVLAAVIEKGSDENYYPSMACYIAFANEKDAKQAYNDIIKTYLDTEDGKNGTKSNVTYCINSDVSAAGSNKIGEAIYLQGTTVIYIRTLAATEDKYQFADAVCKKLGLPSL